MDMQNVDNRSFRPTLTKAGLRQRRFHDLRHTFASLLIQNGESLAYVREPIPASRRLLTFTLIWCPGRTVKPSIVFPR
jgi:integrase